MAVRPWHLLSLCDGYGGTELALRNLARVRTVARVERDSYAAAVLIERMEEKRLDLAPVWDDVATFQGGPWRRRVDIVAAGFPCPDFSSAGLRAGVDGEHWLWPECFEIIRTVGPQWVLLENVPGLVRLGGLTRVCGDLAAVGFDAEWGVYGAGSVGAPHQRDRWWLVAHASSFDGAEIISAGNSGPDVDRGSDRTGSSIAEDVGDTDSIVGRQSTRYALSEHCEAARESGEAESRRRRSPPHVWPPGRDDRDGWAEWIAAGGPQPVVRRLTHGPPLGLADALHLGGNGLVPQCATEAWSQLIRRGGWTL